MNCRISRKEKPVLKGKEVLEPIRTEALESQIQCEAFVRNLLTRNQWRESEKKKKKM